MTAITLDVPKQFADLVAARGLTPAQVLAAFMADLAHTADTNGSDERRHAEAWYDRVMWPEPPRLTLKTYIAESGQWAGTVYRDGEEIAGIAGCKTLDDVLDEAIDRWPDVEHIDLEDRQS